MFTQCLLLVCIPLVVVGVPGFGPKVSHVSPNGRIVGGRDATIEEIPYQVSVQFLGMHVCGGAILSEKYIITAAQCTYEWPNYDYTVRFNTSIYQYGGDVHRVKRIFENPKFNPDTMDYDVSILELKDPVVFGSGVQKIRLPVQGHELPQGVIVSASGWGTKKENSFDLSRQLQVVDILIMDKAQCDKIYKNSVVHYNVTDRMLCAGDYQGGKDSCQGDSGGPLVNNGVLYGLVSWGIGCGEEEYPGVYSNLSAEGIRDFIYRVVRF